MSCSFLKYTHIHLKKKKYDLNVDAPKTCLFFVNCRGSVYRGSDVLANALLC